MENKQQKFGKRNTYTPTDASQVRSPVAVTFNREETLGEHSLKTSPNNLDVNHSQHTGSPDLRVLDIVYVLNMRGQPLMPTRQQKANKLLKQNKAMVVRRTPFTIQLLSATGETKQPINLGIDSGYKRVGFSATTDQKELISGELKLRTDVSKKIQDRVMYRKTRRNHLWHRQPRFNNRIKNKKQGWLAPSIKHKVDAHIRLIDKLKGLLPITDIIVEVAKFDTQKLQDVDIKGVEYQEGQMKGYDNLRAFILHRDKYTCQICKKKDGVMNIHHITQRSDNGSNRPDNLITLHKSCHNKFHKGLIKHTFKKSKSFRQTPVMNNIRNYIVDVLNCKYTYGYITKRNRIDIQLDKSHINDAFIISKGTTQERTIPIVVEQNRRNNRKLQITHKGFKPSIRRQRYNLQPKDTVLFEDQTYSVKGVHSYGKYVLLSNGVDKPKSVNIQKAHLKQYGKGLYFHTSIPLPFENGSFLEVV